MSRRILIMAGGTGGHVFPGLAVAQYLRAQGVTVLWLGTRRGLEARVVPAAGFDIEWITITGLRGRGWLGWLLLPLRLFVAMAQVFNIMRRRRPEVVLSMGGFVAGPGGLVAALLRKPLLVHEQNAVPGMTNRWLAVIADQVLCGFPEAFQSVPGARHVGNPVRPEILALEPPGARLAGHSGRLRLLVVGGSQGARIFNEVIPRALKTLAPEHCPEVWHQCGRGGQPETEHAYTGLAAPARVAPFIEDMAQAYGWADLVVCRAGAMTVAELAAAGVPAILVPYPHAVDDHQSANARFLQEREAAVLVPQPEFTRERLAELVEGFAINRALLMKMAVNARACAMPDATETIGRLCLEALHA